jgi:hypothetical protein
MSSVKHGTAKKSIERTETSKNKSLEQVKKPFNIKMLAMDSLASFKNRVVEDTKKLAAAFTKQDPDKKQTTDAGIPQKPQLSLRNVTDNVLKDFMQ